MKKRIYSMPLVEVANIHFSGALLSSPTTPIPPLGPGAPARRGGGVPVF